MASPYSFSSDPFPVEMNTNYRFLSDAGCSFTVVFIQASRIIELLDPLPVLSNAIYVVVEQLTEGIRQPFDQRIGATITAIIKDYLFRVDINSILVFNCDSGDGRQLKRHRKFERWYQEYGRELDFEKLDQEILEPVEDKYVPTFLSVLFSVKHPKRSRIYAELEDLQGMLDSGK